MICGHCPLMLHRGDRAFCEILEEEIGPNDECAIEEQEVTRE